MSSAPNIRRSAHSQDRPFARISNECLQDPLLSFRARGVLAYVLSKPDNWRHSAVSIAREGGEGRDAVLRALSELKLRGYCSELGGRDARGRISKRLVFFEDPATNGSRSVAPNPPNPENQASVVQASAKPNPENQASVSQLPVEPNPENQASLKQRSLNDRKEQTLETIERAPAAASDPLDAPYAGCSQWPDDLCAVPDSLRTADFAEAWRGWRAHWSESFANGRTMPIATEHTQLRQLVEKGLAPAQAVEAVGNAIAKGLRVPAVPFERDVKNQIVHGAGLEECGDDPLLRSLARVEGSDPSTVTESGLRALSLALSEIRTASPDVTADEIERRGREYRRQFVGAACTAGALARHWAKMGSTATESAKAKPLAIPEPPDWRAVVAREFAGTVYGPGKEKARAPWAEVERDAQRWIAEACAQRSKQPGGVVGMEACA